MRSTFIGVSAFLGRVDSETRCAFWAEEPTDHKFDPARLIAIDLALTPGAAAARQISWDAVQVDDSIVHANGSLGGTTIGPRWPEMRMMGMVYLEESAWRRLSAEVRPSVPPKHTMGRDYEFKAAVYWTQGEDPRAGRRYTGHHAAILEERGTLARVAIYPPGASTRPNVQPRTLWIDLSSPDQCDVGKDSLTAIGVGNAPKQGALFLMAGRIDGAKSNGDFTALTSEATMSFGFAQQGVKIPAAKGW